MSDIVVSNRASDLQAAEYMARAGQVANQAAARHVFEDYATGKAENTLRRHAADLAVFAEFLQSAGLPAGDLADDPGAWHGITWGIVEAFKRWMLQKGYAISSVNFRLSTVKVYAKLATKAGALKPEDLAMIRMVNGFSRKEGKHVDEQREVTRCVTKRNGQQANKKAQNVSISLDQARRLKSQPNTPQGRRDAVIMCILLDHGLRCGELALLQIEHFDLKNGMMTFYRPKVDRLQTHKLTPAALAAVKAYLEKDNLFTTGPLLLGSRKNGKLDRLGMSERAITKRVETLGERVGLSDLSAHDARHYWATDAARNGTHMERLKDAGGWSSLAMPARYIEAAAIANEGIKLSE